MTDFGYLGRRAHIRPVPTTMATHIAPAPLPTPSQISTTAPSSVVPPSVDSRLPVFTTHEATVDKVDNRNALVFSVPAGSSVLLRLVAPPCHAYEERDLRWLHLLQAMAITPSRKVDTLVKLAAQALQLVSSPKCKLRLEQSLRNLVNVLGQEDSPLSFSQKAMLSLRLKDQVARFLREWVKDPVEGYVLRKDHVVGGMRLDDVVATPVGAGYLRGYRREGDFCIVVYPWGHGFIHRSKLEPLDLAIEHERKKRRHNEYLALEHQHLFEQVESLMENYPPADESAEGASGDPGTDSIDLEEYQKLLEELQEEHFDRDVVEHDLTFVRRVQALTHKLTKRQRGSPQEQTHEPSDETALEQEDCVEKSEPMEVEEEKEA